MWVDKFIRNPLLATLVGALVAAMVVSFVVFVPSGGAAPQTADEQTPYASVSPKIVGGTALPNGKYAPPLVGLDDKRLYLAMLTGPQQMPVFSDEVLTPEDKRAIIGYLNALHEQPSAGGLALGGLGPVSEGLWAWIVGLGGLIFFAMWIAAKGAKAK